MDRTQFLRALEAMSDGSPITHLFLAAFTGSCSRAGYSPAENVADAISACVFFLNAVDEAHSEARD